MLCAIGLDITAIVEEVLQAGLQVDTNMWREVVLQADAKGSRPLTRHIKRSAFPESRNIHIGSTHMTNVALSTYWEFQHEPC